MPLNRLFDSAKKNNRSDLQSEEGYPGSNATPPEPFVARDEETKSAEDSLFTHEDTGSFFEKDNRAVRIQRLSQANDLWNKYEKGRPHMSFLRYVFDTQHQAVEALLSVTCIHRAIDTGHLICTEPITLGCYRIIDGRFEAFLAGENLAYSIWSEATEKFSSHHGQYRNQLKPETNERFKFQKSTADQVVFKKEYYQINLTDTKYYQIFEAANTQTAWTFLLLRENVITDRNRYIHVETPEGTICRDVSGIHPLGRKKDPSSAGKFPAFF
jgi:hypothetical protein